MNFKWLDFKITSRCNNKCVYCGVEQDQLSSPEKLSNEEIVSALDDALNLGFTHISLLGGEPSVRRNVEDIFTAFQKKNDVKLIVITNCLSFNERLYRSAFETNARDVKIVCSFDSFKTPNYKNQNPVKVLEIINKIKNISTEYDLEGKSRGVEVHSVISRENLEDIKRLVEYFDQGAIEVSLAMVCPTEIVPEDTRELKYNHFTTTDIKYIVHQMRELEENNLLTPANRILLDYIEKYPSGDIEMNSKCKAGREHVIINPDGNVYPCITESYARGLKFGNIRDRPFREIFHEMNDFHCENDFESACWDHYLWNRVGDIMGG